MFQARKTAFYLTIAALLLGLNSLTSYASGETLATKQLAGGPEDILAGAMQLPHPSTSGIRSHSAMIPINLEPAAEDTSRWHEEFVIVDGASLTVEPAAEDTSRWHEEFVVVDGESPAEGTFRWHEDFVVEDSAPLTVEPAAEGTFRWHEDFVVEDGESLTMMIFAPSTSNWSIQVQQSNGAVLDLATAKANKTPGIQYERTQLGLAANQFPGDLYTFTKPAAGTWNITIHAEKSDNGPDGYLLIGQKSSPYRLYSHLSSYDLLAGNEVGFVTYAFDHRTNPESGKVPTPDASLLTAAQLEVTLPTGETLVLPMADDGQHNDGAANDGVFGARFKAPTVGEYHARVAATGRTATGQAFYRTSDHVFPVIAPSLSLTPQTVTTDKLDETRLQLNLPITLIDGSADRFQVFAEVWGTDKEGTMAPVAWIGGIVGTENGKTGTVLPLALDARWIARAGAAGHFELRNIRVQDVDTHIPVARLAHADLAISALPAAAFTKVETITEEMLMGPRPADAALASPMAYVGGRKLILSHGYCSSGNGWPTAHFTNYAVFTDYNQNRTHDQFAQQLKNFGSQYDSFGIVGNSQGGAASLQLYANYWSGLDRASGARLIQTVGTPYHGSPLAGNLAALGQIFGLYCGTNWDLSYDGAELWLATIPTWARAKVYYHTTSFTDNWWSYDYCHIASDVILSDPDDGAVEKWSGQLSGANNMGHKTGWCHIDGMRDPAQYNDYSRNANMNTYAAR